MPRFLSNLRVRLLLLVLVTAVPGIGLVLYEEFEHWQLAIDVSRQQTLHLAHEISRQHERYIEAARQLLTILAQLPEVQKPQADNADALFADVLKRFPIYTNLAAAKPNGEIFSAGLPFKEPVNIADRPYFQQALRTRDLAVSDYLVGRISGKPNITIAYPAVDNSGGVKAVVLLGLSLDWINKLLGEIQLPTGAVVTLRDHDGMILARYPDPEKWTGKLAADTPIYKAMLSHQGEGTVEAGDLDGVRRLYGFTRLRGLAPDRNIYVSVGISAEIVFSEVNKAVYRDLTLLGMIVVLSLVGVWFGAGQFITRPVNDLVGATKRLAAGDLSARTGLPHGEGELDQLARSFDQMAESLGQNITERKRAEEDVRRNLERTQALREIDQAITSTLELTPVLDIFLQKMDRLFPHSAATVRLLNKETGQLEATRSYGIGEEKEWKAKRRVSRGLPAVVIQTGAPVRSVNVQTDPRTPDPEFFARNGLVSYLGVPLIAKGEALGVLSLYTKQEHDFSKEEVDFLFTLAGQAAIAMQNSQLYEQTKKQAEELRKAIAEMEISNKVKDQFLSVMSHELRTPLNVVLGYTGMLQDGMLGEIPPKQKEVLGKVINRANDLLTLIRDVLQATQIESRSVIVDLHLLNLVDLLDKLKAGYDPSLDKEINFIWNYPGDLPPVITDSEKLKQILQNLIHNAIKFTEKGSVTISVRVTESSKQKAESSKQATDDLPTADRLLPTGERWVEFKVADTGIGIPKETLPFIFDKFRQVDSSETRLYGGVGLGLYIVKKLTELLGATVEVESESGKGSIFTVTLPLEQ